MTNNEDKIINRKKMIRAFRNFSKIIINGCKSVAKYTNGPTSYSIFKQNLYFNANIKPNVGLRGVEKGVEVHTNWCQIYFNNWPFVEKKVCPNSTTNFKQEPTRS